MTERTIPYWVPKRTTPEAVESACAAASLGRLRVIRVEKVTYAPKDGQPGWEVQLRVRSGP